MTGCLSFNVSAFPYYIDSIIFLTTCEKLVIFARYLFIKNKQQMIIVTKPIARQQLTDMAPEFFGDMVKAVVDIDMKILAINAELHADLEKMLIENGSAQESLWGINLYPEVEGDNFIEFDSLINISPRRNNFSRDVEDPNIQKTIRDIVNQLII